MARSDLVKVKELEGRRVGLAIRGGHRLDGCQLVSAGRGRARTLWLFDGTDRFVAIDDVLEVWEAA
jgi:hypothetical protein